MKSLRFTVFLALVGFALASLASAHERHRHKPKPTQSAPAATPAQPVKQALGSEWMMFRSHLGKAEYLHVLLNPIPIYGTAFGALLLALIFITPNDGVRATGLGLLLGTALLVVPTVQLGQTAYDRMYETVPLEGQAWLDVHMERGENSSTSFILPAPLP